MNGTQPQLLQLLGAGQTRAVTGAYSKGKNASQLIKNTTNRILNNKTKPVNELDVNSFGSHLQGILDELHTRGTFSFTLTNISSTGLSDSAVNAWNKTYADAINANKSEEEAATLADQALIDTVADYVFLGKGIDGGSSNNLNFDWMNQYVQQETAGKSGTDASVAVASSKGGTAASGRGAPREGVGEGGGGSQGNSITSLSGTAASGVAAGGESGSTVSSEGGAAANDNLKNIVDTLPGGGIIISGPGSPAEIAQINDRDETLVSADSLQDIVTKHFTDRQTELIDEVKAKPEYAPGGGTGDRGRDSHV